MEEKKFCKFCGEKIDKNNIVCPKCGRQLEKLKNDISNLKNDENPNNKEQNSESKFYMKFWFAIIMLILFAPIGIVLLWKFHPEIKKTTKIILTIIFSLWFLISFIITVSDNSEIDNYALNEKAKVTVIDFTLMSKDEISFWCSENKINCKFNEEYSDEIQTGKVKSQSIGSNSIINQGDKITITMSLGKKPTLSEVAALKKAESYSRTLNMSKKGIYNQLTSSIEGFTSSEAQYAIDHIEANWNANALEKAKNYRETLNMSKNAIYKQLTSSVEAFTSSEAQYAIDHLDD